MIQPNAKPGQVPRPGWPLVTLAAGAFIPVLGVLLGAIAVTWGLVTNRPLARLAIGLGATGVLLQLAFGFWWTIRLNESPEARQAASMLASRDLVRLVGALDEHRRDKGRYPVSLQALVGYPIPTKLLNIYDHAASLSSMRTYVYRVASSGRSFDLFSAGPDGKPDTDDDIRPVLSDSAAAASGYRPPQR